MKLYRGSRVNGVVEVVEDGNPRPLQHRAHHSPTGMTWGYGGSGQADLARSILWDALGAEPDVGLYQSFKWEMVASWPYEGWEISADTILGWAEAYKKGRQAV